ncbi:hypothetical protein Q5752_000784 [Cryptotrichosporon argae]
MADASPSPAASSSRRTPGPAPNMPAGNSSVEASAALPQGSDEPLTGDRVKDLQAAVSRIDIAADLSNLGKMPCARQALLYGIGAGAGLGSVRFLGSRNVRAGANWAVAAFTVVASGTHFVCQNARAKELAQMRMIQERFPHRHVSALKKGTPVDSGAGLTSERP